MQGTSELNSFYEDARRCGFEWRIVDPESQAVTRIASGAEDSGKQFDRAIRKITSDLSEINKLQMHACQKEPCELFRKVHKNLHDLEGFPLGAPIDDFMVREPNDAIKPVTIERGSEGPKVTISCEADVLQWKEMRNIGSVKAVRAIQLTSGEVTDDIRFEPLLLPYGYSFEIVDSRTGEVTVLNGAESERAALEKAIGKLSTDPEETERAKERALNPELGKVVSLVHRLLPGLDTFTHKDLPLHNFLVTESSGTTRRVTVSRGEGGIEVQARTQLDVKLLRDGSKKHLGVVEAMSRFDLRSGKRRNFLNFQPAAPTSWWSKLFAG